MNTSRRAHSILVQASESGRLKKMEHSQKLSDVNVAKLKMSNVF